MIQLLRNLDIKVNDHIYLKDPQSSELGRRIVSGSVDMVDQIGFEHFTFRKLSKDIASTEASIYRYFESKHKLLLYLTSWYWTWMNYNITMGTANIDDPKERLKRAVRILTSQVDSNETAGLLDESKLHHIVMCDSSKSYLTKDVDKENEEGVFSAYKAVVNRVSDIILEINADYKYPHMLISTVIEGSHHQRFFAEHLQSLTDIHTGEDAVNVFYTDIVMKAIEQ